MARHVMTNCEEVLMTPPETLVKKEMYSNHGRLAQDHMHCRAYGHHQSAAHTRTASHRHAPLRFSLATKDCFPRWKPCRPRATVRGWGSSLQLIVPSTHLCFLPIHSGGATDSRVRYLSFLTHQSPSLYFRVDLSLNISSREVKVSSDPMMLFSRRPAIWGQSSLPHGSAIPQTSCQCI